MSIASITGAARVPSSTADTAVADTSTVRQSSAASAAATSSAGAAPSEDAAFKTPVPPRFPWLSRLAVELESAAKQKSAFQPAPILGDLVDKSV